MTDTVEVKTGKLFEAFYIAPAEELSVRNQERRMKEKENFFGNPLIVASIAGSQSMVVSIIGLTAFEMDIDYLYTQKVISEVPYNRMKATIQNYKDILSAPSE